MTSINGKKERLIQCPKCNQEIHYGFFITGEHVCGTKFDTSTTLKLKKAFKDFCDKVHKIMDKGNIRILILYFTWLGLIWIR